MRPALLLLLLPLAACATVPIEPPVMAEPLETCRGAALPSFVGREATQQLGADMLAASGARVLRWVAKGMMVTMDYRGDRLTVYLDGANRIDRASCG